MHAFDRRTDGRTDRNLIAKPRLHSMQRGKNEQSKSEKRGTHEVSPLHVVTSSLMERICGTGEFLAQLFELIILPGCVLTRVVQIIITTHYLQCTDLLMNSDRN